MTYDCVYTGIRSDASHPRHIRKMCQTRKADTLTLLDTEKNSKMLLMAFANEHDKIIKFLQAYILVLERPKDWNIYIDKYISELGANTYYLGQLKDIMLLHLGHNEIKEEDEPRLKNLIKKAAYKLSTGSKRNEKAGGEKAQGES